MNVKILNDNKILKDTRRWWWTIKVEARKLMNK